MTFRALGDPHVAALRDQISKLETRLEVLALQPQPQPEPQKQAQSPQKNSLTPWLIAGGLFAVGYAMKKKAETEALYLDELEEPELELSPAAALGAGASMAAISRMIGEQTRDVHHHHHTTQVVNRPVPGPQGARGPRGLQGAPGKRGARGRDGRDGRTGRAGRDGRDGIDGKDGRNGKDVGLSLDSLSLKPLKRNALD